MAKAKGILVMAVTQCLRGGVSLGAYAVGVALEANGVVSGGDMTTEAVVTKLGYLFGLTNDVQAIRRMMTLNLRGELSPSSSFRHPLIGDDEDKVEARHGSLESPNGLNYSFGPSSKL
ncbi:unnamed protein product [Ectocarpus sp. CCAP 1310/34]|nr:unnamed protein product [Ectocarpus sp. CCAP 1310/34]